MMIWDIVLSSYCKPSLARRWFMFDAMKKDGEWFVITALPSWRTSVETASQPSEFSSQGKTLVGDYSSVWWWGFGKFMGRIGSLRYKSSRYFFLTLVKRGPYTESKTGRWSEEPERTRGFALLHSILTSNYLCQQIYRFKNSWGLECWLFGVRCAWTKP